MRWKGDIYGDQSWMVPGSSGDAVTRTGLRRDGHEPIPDHCKILFSRRMVALTASAGDAMTTVSMTVKVGPYSAIGATWAGTRRVLRPVARGELVGCCEPQRAFGVNGVSSSAALVLRSSKPFCPFVEAVVASTVRPVAHRVGMAALRAERCTCDDDTSPHSRQPGGGPRADSRLRWSPAPSCRWATRALPSQPSGVAQGGGDEEWWCFEARRHHPCRSLANDVSVVLDLMIP